MWKVGSTVPPHLLPHCQAAGDAAGRRGVRRVIQPEEGFTGGGRCLLS